jgi:hypothetical protein
MHLPDAGNRITPTALVHELELLELAPGFCQALLHKLGGACDVPRDRTLG